MTAHLLDSEAVIDYLNGRSPAVELIQTLSRQGDDPCTCDVVIAEVYAGLRTADRGRGDALIDRPRFLVTPPSAAR